MHQQVQIANVPMGTAIEWMGAHAPGAAVGGHAGERRAGRRELLDTGSASYQFSCGEPTLTRVWGGGGGVGRRVRGLF